MKKKSSRFGGGGKYLYLWEELPLVENKRAESKQKDVAERVCSY